MRAEKRLDADWLTAHAIPSIDAETDKNARGRVLLVGGARFVPGALRLTGEAALRAGAGKLQLATVELVALELGVLVPEAAMIALPADEQGEIDETAANILEPLLEKCDALILGPGMSYSDSTTKLVAALLRQPRNSLSVVLDAAALTCAAGLVDEIAAHEGRVVTTPHLGELARLKNISEDAIAGNPGQAAIDAAVQFNSIVVLKGPITYLATPDRNLISLEGDCPGLATSGSGDVLAGIVGGLVARGTDPVTAAGWAIWSHNRAGRLLTEKMGVGFLARELVTEIPAILNKLPIQTPISAAYRPMS